MQGFMIILGSMSLQAGIIVVIALILRKVFEKLHIGKKYMMLFWLLPFFCLVCPFKVNGPIGFWRMSPVDVAVERVGGSKTALEDREDVKQDSGFREGSSSSSVQTPSKQGQKSALPDNMGTGKEQDAVSRDTEEDGKQSISNESQGTSSAEDGQDTVTGRSRILQWFSSSPVIVRVLGGIWLFGMLVLLAGNIVRYVKLKGRLLCSIKIEKHVYIGDEIGTPIVVGFFRPRIYLPSGLSKEHRTYVLAHEKTHIRRGDMFFKMAAYFITCIHWFNPIVWYGFYLFGKDMEMACDEETVRKLGMKEREAYAKTLLDVAEGSALKNKIIFAAPVAFEEGDVKGRIKNIMKYRKTLAVLAVCAVAVCILAGGLFLTKAGDRSGRVQEDSFEKRMVEAGKINLEKLSVKKQEDDGKSQYFVWLQKIQDGMLENFKTVTTEALGIDSIFMNCEKLDFSLGYEFVDLDADGVYELVLGGNMKSLSGYDVNPVYGIYGLREGEIVPILKKGEGEEIFLCENGAITKKNQQTETDPCSYYQYYTYQDLQVHPVETLIYDNTKDAFHAWFYGKGEVLQEEADLVKPLDAQEIQQKYQYKNLFFQVLVKKEKLEKAREAEALQIEYPDREDLTFADLSGLLFWHGSGAGAWHTEIIIKPDGSFEGFYQDGESMSGYYYNYTEYECYFSGKFSNLTKSGPYEYTMKCTEFQAKGKPGEESIQGETLVKTTEPYGFLEADEVRLYLPGKLESELPEAYLSWDIDGLEYGRMTSYGLFNVGDGSGYTVYPKEEPVYEVGYDDAFYEAESKVEARSDEEVKEIIDSLREEYDKESVKYSFADVAGVSFWSSRGSSSFTIRPDGSFYGTCSDGMADMKYTGQFSGMEKIGPSAYLLKCEYTEITEYEGAEPIAPYPYGFDFADEFILYLREKDALNPIGADSLYNIRGNISFVVPYG